VSLDEAAEAIGRKADALKREIEWAQRKNGYLLLQAARLYSSGPYSLAALRRMGHPYARRHAAAPLDPAVINLQTGRFAASWRLESVGGGLIGGMRVVNDAPYAGYLEEGTSRMIRRPIEEKILAENEGLLMRNMNLALERALEVG
jgi:hypothetical protein